MKKSALLLVIFVLLINIAVMGVGGGAAWSAPEKSSASKAAHGRVPDEVLVRLKAGATKKDVAEIKKAAGLDYVIKVIGPRHDVYLFKLKRNVTVKKALKALSVLDLVELAEANYLRPI